MIPVSLRLRNFMCYREGLPPLEFGDLHVACLSGPNGAGKSALLDAITWALWGRARARSDDALVTIGAQEMEVEYEFLLEGNHYRVLRRRDFAARGGRGKSQLDLQVYGPLGWRSMGGEGIRQTEAEIVDLLRMDYHTFINSAFLLQGRADEFTLKPPAERKQILAEILDLSYYDTLEQRAREQMRAEERSVQALSLLLEDLEEQLSTRKRQTQILQAAQETVEQSQSEVTQRQRELTQLRQQITQLEAAARQAEELGQRLRQLEQEMARLAQRIAQQKTRIAEAQALLERGPEIKAQYQRLLQLRDQNEAMAQAAGQLLALSKQQRDLEQTIDQARNQYTTEREVLRRSLAEIEKRLKERPAIENRLAGLQQALASLREKEARHKALLQQIQEQMGEERALKTECQRLRQEMEQLEEKLNLLAESTTHCPLCQSLLGPEEYDHIRLSYETQGQEKRAMYRRRESRIRQLEGQLSDLRGEQRKLEQELKRTRTLERQQAALEKEQQELAQLTEEQESKNQRLTEIETILAERAYATEERDALKTLRQRMSDLHYDHDEHQALQQELAQLRPVEEAHRRLQAGHENLKAEQERLEELQETWQRRQDQAKAEGDRLADLETQVEELPKLGQQRHEAEQALQSAQEALAQARLSLGGAQRELERLQEVEQTWEKKKQAHQQAAERQGIYEDLVSALGKRGVQAMLIETAVPEIEREANELLQQMTGGEMTLQLAMQRATKQGSSMIETLDINISDLHGTRPYESYSGGEKFRINFALRIALSRLLARRAGASLQTLVIDEGFGTQDAQGRERLVEAINTVQDEFAKILVITHIQELKELFPARIEVQKTSGGSTWTIV